MKISSSLGSKIESIQTVEDGMLVGHFTKEEFSISGGSSSILGFLIARIRALFQTTKGKAIKNLETIGEVRYDPETFVNWLSKSKVFSLKQLAEASSEEEAQTFFNNYSTKIVATGKAFQGGKFKTYEQAEDFVLSQDEANIKNLADARTIDAINELVGDGQVATDLLEDI